MEIKQPSCGCVLDPNIRGKLPEEMEDAAMEGNIKVVQAWVANGGNVNATCISGRCKIKQEVTLLSHAASGNQVGIVSWLLQQESICLNVPVNFENLNSTLIIAAREGHADIINMLITAKTKCKLDLKLLCGCYFAKPHGAIWHAAFKGHRSALSVLLQHHEGDLLQLQEAYFWLAQCLPSDSIKMLLTDEFKNKIDLSGRNSRGEGVLYIASKHEMWYNFCILFEHHAHDVEDLNHALFEVVNHGHSEFLKTYLQPPLKDVIDLGAHDDVDGSLLEVAFRGRLGCQRPPELTDCANHYLTAGAYDAS
ncbi:unnamed protein product [Meganyctiphanes norvegica]|uniref:Uncharacterized protein n=1 Tax=Meganyctiphanes norvegica TaxID=48144 RepID=A0AAV2RMX7_MEGNR